MTLSRMVRFAALLLIPLLAINSMAVAAPKPMDAGAMKTKIQSRGVGQGVRVTLADHTDAKGLIVSISDRSFVLKPKGADPVREIAYDQITGVHRDKLSTGQKVTIGVVIFGAAVGITAAVLVVSFDHSFKGPIL